MLRTWPAEGFSAVLAMGVPALVASAAVALLSVAVRWSWPVIQDLLSDRPSRLVVVRVLLPPTTARGPAGSRRR
jgi:hypothetical protein